MSDGQDRGIKQMPWWMVVIVCFFAALLLIYFVHHREALSSSQSIGDFVKSYTLPFLFYWVMMSIVGIAVQKFVPAKFGPLVHVGRR